MKKDLRTISFTVVSSIALIVLSGCDARNGTKKPKGVVAIVYSDLTKSINEETANKQKENIGQLFRQLPVNSKFFLYSIDRGSNKPNIYEFIPKLTVVKIAEDEDKLKQDIEDNKKAKETTEYAKLNSSLNSYQASIASQKGPVSCISNQLNSLLDLARNKRTSFPDYEIRVFFYSDMIEHCDHSFDGQPLTFQRSATAEEEAKHLQDIRNRIDQKFEQATPQNNLKSMGTKIYIVLTSQDDKQDPRNLKSIWNTFFGKLGLQPDDLSWTNGNEDYFWQVPK